jgi:hypothetical protein
MRRIWSLVTLVFNCFNVLDPPSKCLSHLLALLLASKFLSNTLRVVCTEVTDRHTHQLTAGLQASAFYSAVFNWSFSPESNVQAPPEFLLVFKVPGDM